MTPIQIAQLTNAFLHILVTLSLGLLARPLMPRPRAPHEVALPY